MKTTMCDSRPEDHSFTVTAYAEAVLPCWSLNCTAEEKQIHGEQNRPNIYNQKCLKLMHFIELLEVYNSYLLV